jgi:hypothetical protein
MKRYDAVPIWSFWGCFGAGRGGRGLEAGWSRRDAGDRQCWRYRWRYRANRASMKRTGGSRRSDMTRGGRGRSHLGFGGSCRIGYSAGLRIEGTADFIGNMNLPLRSASNDQCRVEPWQNVSQRKLDSNLVAIDCRRKHTWRGAAQFSEAYPDSAGGELREHFLKGDGY